MKLRAIVVDDEEFARKNLVMLLEEYCPDIEVIGEASRKSQAKAILNLQNRMWFFLIFECLQVLKDLNYWMN
jgi:two-component system, LytTR family, response regulator